MNRGHEFTTIFDGTSYTFIALDDETITPINGAFRFNELNIHQGRLVTDVYRYNSQIANQRFPILNTNVDTSTIKINITSNNTVTAWSKAGDLTNITTNSTVFYLQENDDGLFEVYFGDGVIGKEPIDSDEISISYLVKNNYF